MSILLIVWVGVVLAISTSHIREVSGTMGRVFCSLTLFALSAFTIFVCGQHKCDEGGAPVAIVFGTAALTACLPWVLRRHPWLMRVVVAVVIYAAAIVASNLTHSYHADDITGNPRYASGRFWHTLLTGQYPRALEYTRKARVERQYQAPINNSEPERDEERH